MVAVWVVPAAAWEALAGAEVPLGEVAVAMAAPPAVVVCLEEPLVAVVAQAAREAHPAAAVPFLKPLADSLLDHRVLASVTPDFLLLA